MHHQRDPPGEVFSLELPERATRLGLWNFSMSKPGIPGDRAVSERTSMTHMTHYMQATWTILDNSKYNFKMTKTDSPILVAYGNIIILSSRCAVCVVPSGPFMTN